MKKPKDALIVCPKCKEELVANKDVDFLYCPDCMDFVYDIDGSYRGRLQDDNDLEDR